MIKVLDSENPGSSRITTFVVDGAGYHSDRETRHVIKQMGIKYLILAPYYYSGSVCELYYSRIKSGELNAMNLRLGKK